MEFLLPLDISETATKCHNADFFCFRLINCKPANEKAASKPLNLVALEAESLRLRSEKMFQAELYQGDGGPGSVRIEIKPVLSEGMSNF